MGNEPNIAELAVAAWRLERWLDNLVAERKMAAKSSLRSIKKYLDASGIEIVDPIGMKFDPGLAIEVVNNESPDFDEANLIIIDTNSPIIKKDGAVIQYGRVILETNIKEQKPNSEIRQNEEVTDAVASPKKDEISEPVQSDLYIDPKGHYWLKKFIIKTDKPEYKAAITVTADAETHVLLLDEKVYKEYCRGIRPMNPFWYKGRVGNAYVAIPYQDVWYMVVYPPDGHQCSEYHVDMNFEWIPVESIAPPPVDTSKKNENAVSADAVGTEVPAVNGENTTDAPQTEPQVTSQPISEESETVTQAEIPDQTPAEKSAEETTDRELSEEEFNRLMQKNKASYTRERAIMSGALKQPYHKKRK